MAWHQVILEPWASDEFAQALWKVLPGVLRAATEFGSVYVRPKTLTRMLALPGASECIEGIVNDIDEEEVRWELQTRWLVIRDV